MSRDELCKTAQECSNKCERVDIKTELEGYISHLQNQINELNETLRVKREQLKLINKDKNLEAYLNLTRNYY